MADLTISKQDYESLVALARRGTIDENHARDLEEFLVKIEEANGITRYFLAVRWQELDAPVPPHTAGNETSFPDNWPPELEGTIELTTRPIAKADVLEFLDSKASNPTSVMVTTDPGLRVGWTPIDDYFTA